MKDSVDVKIIDIPGDLIVDAIDNTLSINDKGHVIGWSQIKGVSNGFYYDGASVHNLNLEVGRVIIPHSINNSGSIAGYVHIGSNYKEGRIAAILYNGNLRTHDPLGLKDSRVVDINNNDVALIQNGGGSAFIWDGESFSRPVNHLEGLQVNALNDKQEIVGIIRSRKGGHAFFCDGETLYFHNLGREIETNLTKNEIKGSSAWGINNSSSVVGFFRGKDLLSRVFCYCDKKIVEFEGVKDRHSTVLSINDVNYAVGYSWIRKNNAKEANAVFWRNGELIDLNSILNQRGNLFAVKAVDINSSNQILAVVIVEGFVKLCIISLKSQ